MPGEFYSLPSYKSLGVFPNRGWQNIASTPVVFEAGILKGWGEYYYEERLGSPRIPKDQ